MKNLKLKNIKPLCWIMANDNNVLEKFKKLADRCFTLTSDYGVYIKVELYQNNIESYIIEGTRCKLRITYDNKNKKVVRKPYKAIPILSSDFEKFNCMDLEKIIKYIKKN